MATAPVVNFITTNDSTPVISGSLNLADTLSLQVIVGFAALPIIDLTAPPA